MDIRYKILEAREARMKYIRLLIEKHNKLIVVIKSNICGNDKNPCYSKFLKNYFYIKVSKVLDVCSFEYVKSDDGDYYILVISNKDVLNVKSLLVGLENSNLGRLIDLDLYSNKQKSVSRSDLNLESRKCIVCNNDISICSRMKFHLVSEVNECFKNILVQELVNIVVDLSFKAMIDEVGCHPKFGLVTKYSNGKHLDMDYNTFVTSANAIKPYLYEYAKEGVHIDNFTFEKLRSIGKRAERAMFNATDGVNTHKGIIFILGFLLPAIVSKVLNGNDIVSTIKYLSKDIYNDFEDCLETTFGINAYKKYNITGIRGEVKNGLIHSFDIFNKYKDCEVNNLLILKILLSSMSVLDDTVILHRASIDYLEYTKDLASKLLRLSDEELTASSNIYTNKFIQDNVSPGGSADVTVTVLILIYFYKIGGI